MCRILHRAYVLGYVLFMVAPLIVVVGASFERQELLRFPPTELSLRWYRAALDDEVFLGAASNSLQVAVLATLGSLLLGVPAAYGLARHPGRAAPAVRAMLNAPLLVPELVLGVALLQVMARTRISNSLATIAAGHVLVCLPYVIRTSGAALLGLDPSLEEAARTLGASRLRATRRIVLPAIRPALLTATLFAFLLSFDNAVISLFLVSARTTTLPIAIYSHVQFNLDPTIAAVSALLMLVSVAAMAIAHRLQPLEQIGA